MPTLSRSYDNIRSLISDTAEMSKSALARSPLPSASSKQTNIDEELSQFIRLANQLEDLKNDFFLLFCKFVFTI